jgi:hypothetical protein
LVSQKRKLDELIQAEYHQQLLAALQKVKCFIRQNQKKSKPDRVDETHQTPYHQEGLYHYYTKKQL